MVMNARFIKPAEKKQLEEKQSVVLLDDRSGAEIDDKCGMMYWMNRIEGGIGISPTKKALPLLIGSETHNDLATIAKMSDIRPEAISELVDDLLSELTPAQRENTTAMELFYRRLGWLVAFALYMEPRIRAEWDNVWIEDELILKRDPLYVPVTPDRILRSKKDSDHLIYKEYKTVTRAWSSWVQSWQFAIQLHIGIAAAQEELGQTINYAQVMGLQKGYYSQADDRLNHPYTWGYYNERTSEWEHRYDFARDKAWVKMPVWEYPGGIVKWVQLCGEEVGLGQFPHSAPVFLNPRMLDEWVARRKRRQFQIKGVRERCRTDEKLRAIYFERRQAQCRSPYTREACPYLLACWNAEVNANPLAHPDYEPRQPHHEVEIVGILDE